MTALTWQQTGTRFYETGIDRGVLYVGDKPGVPWFGLTGIDESIDTTSEPVFYDGVKFNDLVTLGDFAGAIRAYTYPDEFLECEGTYEDQEGFFLTGQMPKRFNITYRTMVGEGSDNLDSYKLHLLYNLTATPVQVTRTTLSFTPEPNEFQWNVTGIPEDIDFYRPTSHVVLDSRVVDPWLLLDIETILYGDDANDPRMPSLKGLTSFIRKWNRLIIVDNDDGTWTAISRDPNDISVNVNEVFTITADNVVELDANTYTIESTNKNEEDL